MKKVAIISLTLIVLISLTAFSHAQKEANMWFFGRDAAVDFNGGLPVVLDPPPMAHGAFFGYSTMCDSAGNLMMICTQEKIYNRDFEVYENSDIPNNHFGASQGSVIVKKPGSDNLYCVFSIASYTHYGIYYWIIDMNLDNGKGEVIESMVLVPEGSDASSKILAVNHVNNRDIWIITRKYLESSYAAFLLTDEGLNLTPVITPVFTREINNRSGNMKVTHDKKYLVAAYNDEGGPHDDFFKSFDICRFNASTGIVDHLYVVSSYAISPFLEANSVEFSPDSKYLYLNHRYTAFGEEYYEIYQYDMSLLEDSTQFVDSGIKITEKGGSGLQLARDGKIYCGLRYWPETIMEHNADHDYLNVINKPWIRGTGCDYRTDWVDLLDHGTGKWLANVLTDYLFRFEWEGRCSAEPFTFQSNFEPDPVQIIWNFSDPGAGGDSISYELNPVHYFTQAGEFEVKVEVNYPNGRVEYTSSVVTVFQSPKPDLGPDTLKCIMDEIVLNAGNEEGMYVWSTGSFGQNANEVTVSDTGWYWVDVTNDVDCTVRDSIHVGLYPPSEFNEDDLVITPTSCGGSNGKINGLNIIGEEPLSYEWFDADSNLLSNSIDIEDLPVGNYFLHVLDGYGCTTISEPYTITDAGDIQISEVIVENSHCDLNNGQIEIIAWSGATEDLVYSIDNGNSWNPGNNIFTGLSPGNYFIRVKDESDCESAYDQNPVMVLLENGPVVSSVSSSPEIDNLSNGQIEIQASTGDGQLHYSIDDGNTFQTNNGLFTNLTTGLYSCIVKDDHGCDTTFLVEVDRVLSHTIYALAGSDSTCIGDAAVSPLILSNFENIIKFHVTLSYDTTYLACDNFYNPHPDLESNMQTSVVPELGRVIISWESDTPTTIQDNTSFIDLILTPKKEAFTDIDWVTTLGESTFYNENYEEVHGTYQLGKIRIYEKIDISMSDQKMVCEGEETLIIPFVWGGTGEQAFEWYGPNDFSSNERTLYLPATSSEYNGQYIFTVYDTVGCEESKEVNLIVVPKPVIAFQDHDTLFVEPDFILEAGIGYESYLWNTGDTTEAIYIDTEGLYSVYVISTENCKSSDSVTVLFGGEPFFMPNAFSPNRDGLNDEFKPVQRYDYVNSYHLFVYSRWGELIFETSDIEQGWDGNHKGKTAPLGTYVYRIVYTAHSTGTETQVKTGHFSLVK